MGAAASSPLHQSHEQEQNAAHSSSTVTSSSPDEGNGTDASGECGPTEEADVVVIGAGIGGLTCAAMLAHYGFEVVVCESHSTPGGAAHCWTRRGCHFDSGTALFFGLPASDDSPLQNSSSGGKGGGSDNPLAAVLRLLGESIDLVEFGPERTALVFPEGVFRGQIGSLLFADTVRELWGTEARDQWLALQRMCCDLAAAAVALHPLVVRHDPGIAATAMLRRPLKFLKYAAAAASPLSAGGAAMRGAFSGVAAAAGVRCPALLEFLDVLCLGTCGARAEALPAAYAVRVFSEMYGPDTVLQWPIGGPQAIVDALVRALRARGGRLLLGTHVTHVLPTSECGGSGHVTGGKSDGRGSAAGGVRLRGGRVVRARRAVVSNASLWDTLRLVPSGAALPAFVEEVEAGQCSDSFVHLHAVVERQQQQQQPLTKQQQQQQQQQQQHLTKQQQTQQPDLPVHTYFLSPSLVGDTGWPTLTIGTAVDASLAPPGQDVLHCYRAEPFGPWEGLARGGAAYEARKGARAEALWGLMEQVLPGSRQRLQWQTVGTPLTHERFRRRHRGAYGLLGTAAGGRDAPRAVLAMQGLFCCGDNVMPYIGTPAVAASGAWVANTLAPLRAHLAALDAVDR